MPITAAKIHLRRGVLMAVVLAIAALVLPPFVNVSRYKSRVVESVSKAFGRPVTCDSIELRLLPQPGFYLTNVTVDDDPAYSLEPILHADELTAYIGFSSLWRGRMEISRVNLNYPSLNLVERADGSWNFESLLWKTSRTQTAPTAARPSISRVRFPYIEVSNGRINFKYGLEKSVFSLTDTDFKLWSPAEDQWRMQLDAQPVRTDMPVTDTGRIKGEATIQRATMLGDSPMQASVSWERVQLGNLTRLVDGQDRGWRGELDASAQFSGTASALHFTTAARVREFRRFDVASENETNLNATCQGEWNIPARLLQNTECGLPLGDGRLAVRGTLSGVHAPRYDLAITSENVSAGALLDVVRHAKHNLPDDLSATGTLSGALHVSQLTDAPSSWIGELNVASLGLRSSTLGKDLAIGNVTIAANIGGPTASGPDAAHPRSHNHPAKTSVAPRALIIQSFSLPLGGSTPAKADGTLDARGFALHLKGDASLERLQQFARALDIAAPKFSLTGPVSVDLLIGAHWPAFDQPQVSGTALLKNTRANIPGLLSPVEIASARVDLDGDHIALRNASAAAGKVTLGGSASFPRACATDSPCVASFDLTSDELNLARWNELLNPHTKKTPWYEFGGDTGGSGVFANLHASGHFASRHLILDPVTGTAFETNFSFGNGILQLKQTRATMLGGLITGDWTVDFTGPSPRLEATGAAQRIQAEKLAPLMKASLGSGTLNVQYAFKTSGWDAASLARSSSGEASFTWSGGVLKISPHAPAPLRVLSGKGIMALGDKGWTITSCDWKTPAGDYSLSGSVSRSSALDLEFAQGNGSTWKLGGTMAKPEPARAATTQSARR